MKVRTDDNFSENRSDFDNLSNDLVSRDAIAQTSITPRVKKTLARFLSLSDLRRWFERSLKSEREYGTAFLIYSCCFGLGAIFWFSSPITPPVRLLLPLLVFFCVQSIWQKRYRGAINAPTVACSFLLLGSLSAELETMRKPTVILDSSVTTTIQGTVERREVDSRGIWRYQIQLGSTRDPEIRRAPPMIQLVARQKHAGFAVGDMIEGRARLSPPSGPAIVGGNDFAFNAYFNEIGGSGFFFQLPKLVAKGDDAKCFSALYRCLDRGLYKLRAAIAERIRDAIGGDAGALSASIITDERRAISPEVMDALRQSGLAHIVAISGLNMALAAGIFFVGLRIVFSSSQFLSEALPTKKMSAALALTMTLAYYLISGFAVSAERAWIMMSVMLIAVLLDRQAISLRNVAISALVIAVVSPSEIMGASFQMSFAATLALVALYGAWARRPVADFESHQLIRHPLWKMLRGMIYLVSATMMTSVIGGLATAPFSIAYFNQIAPLGLVANLMAMPLMGLIVMPAALIAMLLMPFGGDWIFLQVMGFGIQLVMDVAQLVASWSDDYLIGRLPAWFLPLIVASLTTAAILRSSLAWIALTASGLLIGALSFSPKTVPDLIIHESGELILLRHQEGFATNQKRPSDFIYSQWQRAFSLPDKPLVPVIEPTSSDEEEEAEDDVPGRLKTYAARHDLPSDRFTCVPKQFCILRHKDLGMIVQALDIQLLGQACDVAEIVVTPIQSRMKACRSGAKLFTGRLLRQSGTLEFYLSDNGAKTYRIEAALNGRMRPWTMHRFYDWRVDAYTPMELSQ